MSYFPMFIDLKGRRCLVVGGGKIALHKVKVLMDFEARITVIAPDILPEICETANITCQKRCFEENDLDGQELVVAATGDPAWNHWLSGECKKNNIPVNVVDEPKECSFIFPAYLKEGEVVAAFSSGGQSPVITQYLKEQIRSVMTPQIGEVARCLGNLRETVQRNPKTRGAGKQIYRELLQLSIEMDRVPTDEEIKRVLQKYM